MPVYRRFGPDDVSSSTLTAHPRVSVAHSGTWRGSSGPSGSLSLYSGVRSRVRPGVSVTPMDAMDTRSIEGVVYVSGSYPATGSIHFVRCSDEPQPGALFVTNERWYEEHYRPVWLLSQHRSRWDGCFYMGSSGFYSVFLPSDTNGTGSAFVFSGSLSGSSSLVSSTGSFAYEAWVKVLDVDSRHTVACQPDSWFLSLSSSLAFSGSNGSVEGGQVTPGVWHHVAVSVADGVSASLYLDSVLVGSGSTYCVSSNEPLIVGSAKHGAAYSDGLNGFIFESRAWRRSLGAGEIRTHLSGVFYATSSFGPAHYARFDDGPLGVAHGFSAGSGAFDHSPTSAHGGVVGFDDDLVPHWQPNDHPTFSVEDRRRNVDIGEFRAFCVPSMFYGRQIEPGSVRIRDGVYSSRGVVRVLEDDGRGCLYVSGSMTRAISGEEYRGDTRRKVGNVFYSEGVIVLTEPALFDIDLASGTTPLWDPTLAQVSGAMKDLLTLDFRGHTRTFVSAFDCRLGSGRGNASRNPTFVTTGSDGSLVPVSSQTYVSSIGIFDAERRLVMVAKLSRPMRKRLKDRLDFRITLDW